MRTWGLTNGLAGSGMDRAWSAEGGGNQPNDCKIKGRPSGRRMWLFGFEIFLLTRLSLPALIRLFPMHSMLRAPSPC